jgi:hypothetical protein
MKTVVSGFSRTEQIVEDSYNSRVERRPLALDTPLEVEQRQIEQWRRMSAAEKAAIVSGLTQAAYALAFAGVRQRYPHADSREQFLRVAMITLGPDLARKAYPEIVALGLE